MASFRLALGPTAHPGPAEALQVEDGHQVRLAVSVCVGQLREVGREGLQRPWIEIGHKVEIPGLGWIVVEAGPLGRRYVCCATVEMLYLSLHKLRGEEGELGGASVGLLETTS